MTSLLVASNGGHLVQLVELSSRCGALGPERHWVTFRGPQGESLLAGERVTYVPAIRERDRLGVLRAAAGALRLFNAERIKAVVSTGSAIALAFIPQAVMRGIEAHYIESSARVRTRSSTGRLLACLPGVRLYHQFPECATGRWRYGGSVFDSFESQRAPRRLRRLVVTVGSDRPFRRLLERLANVVPPGIEVLWQTGPTSVDGLAIESRPFLPALELAQAVREADVVVAHAGCGSALTALKAGKCPILVPRLAAHGEAIDDHQRELAAFLARRGLALYRSAEEIVEADLQVAAARAVVRQAAPPPFHLTSCG